MNEESKPFRWSFSSWEVYESCPQKWRFKHKLHLPSAPSGPAAARGSDLHDRVEKYITGQVATIDPDPTVRFGDKRPAQVDRKYIPILDEFRYHPNGDRWAERKLAFNPAWEMVTPRADDAACVAVLDAARYTKPKSTVMGGYGLLKIGEWKSGKPKDTHGDQRKLYALAGMVAWQADEVEVTTYYLEGTAEPQRLVLKSQSGLEKLKALWDGRAALMARDNICAPRPGQQCRWCDYAKDKGGPCIFG